MALTNDEILSQIVFPTAYAMTYGLFTSWITYRAAQINTMAEQGLGV